MQQILTLLKQTISTILYWTILTALVAPAVISIAIPWVFFVGIPSWVKSKIENERRKEIFFYTYQVLIWSLGLGYCFYLGYSNPDYPIIELPAGRW